MIMHALPTLLPAVRRDEKANRVLYSFAIMVAAAAALLMQAPCAHAQHASPPPSMSDKEKAKIQEKRAFQKETDDAYQSTISRMPDVKQQKVDPWGNMRAAPQK
jgi:hypothetical protein